MKKEKILKELKNFYSKDMTNSFDFYEWNNEITITFNDFEGFDEDWDEIYKSNYDSILENKILSFLKENCISIDNIEHDFIFEDCIVDYTYMSYDI